MKKILTSFGFGSHSKFLEVATPSFYRYGSVHNYDCFFPSENFFSTKIKNLPHSWWKVEVITHLLQSYDIVLWLDSDVIICDTSTDISESLTKQDEMGLVIHEVPIGFVPNCGIWILKKESLKWINDLWLYNKFMRSDGWWEQAAMMYKLGFNPDEPVVSLPESFEIPFCKLDYLWNPHVHDHRGLPNNLKFLHFTMFADRLGAMKEISKRLGYS